MSKTLIVYYSLEGNSEYAAAALAEFIEGETDTEHIVPVTEPPKEGFGKFLRGGKSVVFGETPALEELTFKPEEYDNIVFVFPIWAGSYPPAVATYIKDHPVTGKKLYAVACSGGGKGQKAVEKLAAKLPGCTLVSSLNLIEPLKNKDKTAEHVKAFAAQIK